MEIGFPVFEKSVDVVEVRALGCSNIETGEGNAYGKACFGRESELLSGRKACVEMVAGSGRDDWIFDVRSFDAPFAIFRRAGGAASRVNDNGGDIQFATNFRSETFE